MRLGGFRRGGARGRLSCFTIEFAGRRRPAKGGPGFEFGGPSPPGGLDTRNRRKSGACVGGLRMKAGKSRNE
jgi:hypothetical protein